jgi:CYTH domain-containing protein/predicted ATPase
MAHVNSQLIEPVSMIVLTGGPCSGKSSSLAYLTEKLSDHGFMVFVIPETATLITGNGIDRRKMDKPRQIVMFEEAIFDMQVAFEDTYKSAVAKIFPEKRKVILLDRAIMDIKAFVSGDDFKALLKRKGVTEANLRHRYNGVIHLVTAADGAEEYYTGENNTARLETPEEAVLIDRKIQESWLGHPHFKIIDNSTDFQYKIRRTFAAMAQLLGIPIPLPTQEKYLVKDVCVGDLPARQILRIEQVYLRSKDRNEEIRIRRRGQDGVYLHFLSRSNIARNGSNRVAEEELIPEQEYLNLTRLMDPKTEILRKERVCFLWNNQYFELDSYSGRHEGLKVLIVEPLETEAGKRVQVPPFITVGKLITHDPRYADRNMARRRKEPKDIVIQE